MITLHAVEARLLLESTMAVVRDAVRTMDVMQVTPHASPDADPLVGDADILPPQWEVLNYMCWVG